MTVVSYRCGECHMDVGNRSFSRAGATLAVEPKVFAVMLELLARPATLVTREDLLDAVWGHRFVTPSTLNRVIGLARRAFGDDIDEPRFIQTVHGTGYRYIGPIEVERAAPEGAPARFGPPPTARLPGRIQELIGREYELELLEKIFRRNRAITLLGTGGMGKTQCALEYARRRAVQFPDGVWFFDLAPTQRADEWVQAVARSLAIAPRPERGLLEDICQLFATRRALLVIDNCDRLAPEIGAVVMELLRGTEALQVLTTSQQPLSFVGEWIVRLPPLALPSAAQMTKVQDVEMAPAVALLLVRVRALQPEFSITSANARTMVEICRRLDGMPLALELAASRFAFLSADQVLERLDHRFGFLTSDAAGRDHRHRNLTALLAWSFGLLSPTEQRLLKRLAVFVQGWTMEAVIDLAAVLGLDAETGVELITSLANKSLVMVDHSLSPPRYRLLESVREFALDQLRAAGEETAARDAHLLCVEKMCARSHQDFLGGRMRERVGQLLHEHGNIEGALGYAASDVRGSQSALVIVGSLMLYFKARGDFGNAMRWCERALAGAAHVDDHSRGRAILCLAVLRLHAAPMEGATEDSFLDAERMLATADDDWAKACLGGYYALWLAPAGREQQARYYADTAARIAEHLDDAWLRSLAGLAHGFICMARGASADAIVVMQSALGKSADIQLNLFLDAYLALAHLDLGQQQIAAGYLYPIVMKSFELGSARVAAGAAEGCAYLVAKLGQFADAARYLGMAQRVRERALAPLFLFWLRHHDQACAASRAALGDAGFESLLRAGAEAREEDITNEVTIQLRQLAGSQLAPGQRENTPAGS